MVWSMRNQYRGVNAHLNSWLQSKAMWGEFHAGYLLNLYYAILQPLLDMNYDAAYEPSLQIRRLDEYGWDAESKEPDLAIYELDPLRAPPASYQAGVAERLLPIEAILISPLSEKDYPSVRIYDRRSEQREPICWIELLSPTNKNNRRDRNAYLDKRESIILSGTVFVEIDFLHETAPLVSGLAAYGSNIQSESDAPHPYHIIVVDPRPIPRNGLVRLREFDVDEMIPQTDIHLNGSDVLTIDFDAIYQHTFAAAHYGQRFVNYARLPVNFDRYHAYDQARILNRMLAVVEAAKTGHDLEASECVPKTLTRQQAVAALADAGITG